MDQIAATKMTSTLQPRVITDPEDFQVFRTTLESAGLPYKDLNVNDHLLIGYYDGDHLVGTGGLEIYGDYGLLRSVSIHENSRGKNLGTKIALHLIDKARASELKGLYLLTETAQGFFEKLGFISIHRDDAEKVVKASAEFTHVCPSTAVCMYLDLKKTC